MKIVVGISVLFLLIFVPYNAFAEDRFEMIGKTLTHDPTICALEPETDIKDAWKTLSKYTRWAVLDWENQLNQHNRVRDVWNLELQLITLEKQTHDLQCDITIEFLPKPQNKEEEFQVSGYTQRHATNDIDVVIYYLNVELDRLQYTKPAEQEGYYYTITEWIPSYTDYLVREEPLMMTLKHELGHALGLGHYITDDDEKFQRWYDGVQRPPSVMIPTKPTKVISAYITQLDVEMLTKIYGSDGFYSEEKIDKIHESATGSERITLPDWIKNNAKWWSEGILSDSDFATGVEHMIKNEIIKVPLAETDSFSVEQKIPEWVKNNAKWWSEGQIPAEEFVRGLQYLVKTGIIKI